MAFLFSICDNGREPLASLYVGAVVRNEVGVLDMVLIPGELQGAFSFRPPSSRLYIKESQIRELINNKTNPFELNWRESGVIILYQSRNAVSVPALIFCDIRALDEMEVEL